MYRVTKGGVTVEGESFSEVFRGLARLGLLNTTKVEELLPFWGWVPSSQSDLVSFGSELDVVCNVLKKELLELAQVKGTLYQDESGVDSCLKRGFAGLYHNLARKWDRIEAVGIRLGWDRAETVIASEAALDGVDPETLYATVRDLAVYTIHTLRWLKSRTAEKGKGEQ